MITRQDYMNSYTLENGYLSFREYYRQFVNKRIISIVVRTFGKEKLKEAYKADKHFNTIPLRKWDGLAGYINYLVNPSLLREAKEGCSLSTAVCIAKTAAELIAQE